MESKYEIAAPWFAAERPELFHYTNRKGLCGILKSSSLWGTHFSQLNDSMEVMLLRGQITKGLASRIKPHRITVPEVKNRHSRRAAAKIAANSSLPLSDFVASMFDVAFHGFINETRGTKEDPLGDPYITSFCVHSTESYEAKNGLLSQWRAYGDSERYCIVFDTRKMEDLLAHEWNRHYYNYLRLTEVIYDMEDVSIEGWCPDLLKVVEEAYYKFRKGSSPIFSEEGVAALLSSAPRFKHQGFREEQEVRIIAIPGKESTVAMMLLERPEHKVNPLKAIHSRAIPTGECRYVALFECLEEGLPIKRIIVGPAKNQTENFGSACRLVKNKFPLSRSATPFIG